MRGVCVDANNPVARPGVRRLKNYGLTGVRLVATDEPGFYAYHSRLRMAHFETAVVLTGTSFQTDDYLTEARAYAFRVAPTLWLCGNEWNIAGDASWPPGGDPGFRDFWRRAASGILQAQPAAELWIGGMYSQTGLVDRLQRVLSGLRPAPTGVDIHPYEDMEISWEEVAARVRALGLKVGVLEWNDSDPGDTQDFEETLEATTDHSCWIPWDTRQLTPALPGIVRGPRVTPVGAALREMLRMGR